MRGEDGARLHREAGQTLLKIDPTRRLRHADLIVNLPLGMVTLSWLPPTQNDDGTTLKDLAGYRIYVGQDPDALSRVIVLNNPGLTRYAVDGLSPATWHFAMTSFNRKGQESTRSATVSKQVG